MVVRRRIAPACVRSVSPIGRRGRGSAEPLLTPCSAVAARTAVSSTASAPAPNAPAATKVAAATSPPPAALERTDVGNNEAWASHDTGPVTRRRRGMDRFRNARTTVGSKCVPALLASSAQLVPTRSAACTSGPTSSRRTHRPPRRFGRRARSRCRPTQPGSHRRPRFVVLPDSSPRTHRASPSTE